MQTIHTFQVLPVGTVSAAFRAALRKLSDRGFADPSCVIVKTASGRRSGITHEGGRYIHAQHPYAATVIEMMRDQGIQPPTPPFIVAPGRVTLLHEWGHHTDHVWSRDDHSVPFSFRWFSHFYEAQV